MASPADDTPASIAEPHLDDGSEQIIPNAPVDCDTKAACEFTAPEPEVIVEAPALLENEKLRLEALASPTLTDSEWASFTDRVSLNSTETDTDATSIPSDTSECGTCTQHQPIPDRDRCKESMLSTPNKYVWAHRREDLKLFGQLNDHEEDENKRYWSPSMVRAGEKILMEERAKEDELELDLPSFCERVYGQDWDGSLENEPVPRKLRVWPVLTMKDWSPDVCPEELRGDVDDCVNESTVKGATSTGLEAVDNDVADSEFDEEQQTITEHASLFQLFEPPSKIPQLEQPIPAHLLPEILMVTDPDALCGRHREKRQPVAEKYIRVYPPIESTSANDSTKPPIAHLTLPPYAYVGDGNHSRAYSANLTLDDRFTLLEHSQSTTPTRTWGLATVQVVAKVTSRHSEDRKMLATEAKMYTSMLQRRAHLSEHWSGFNAIDEASESNEHVGNDTRVPATAVLPQFYGYYIPAAGSSSTGRPIMLLEHCGAQIDLSGMSKPEKTTCYTFLERLWSAGIMQNSFYARNIVMKPGPLTHPPDLRSFDEPSFRIIDFGRGEWLSKAQRQHDWERMSSQQERALKLERAMAVDAIYGGTRRYKYR